MSNARLHRSVARQGAAIFLGLSLGTAWTVASAQQNQALTGIDKIHNQARTGNKVCMTQHRHAGEGIMPSQRGAEAAAIRHWKSFTAWEYGTAWGDHSLAVKKTMKCTQAGGQWTCVAIAHPCRPGR